jgi:hypothetical protein
MPGGLPWPRCRTDLAVFRDRSLLTSAPYGEHYCMSTAIRM